MKILLVNRVLSNKKVFSRFIFAISLHNFVRLFLADILVYQLSDGDEIFILEHRFICVFLDAEKQTKAAS